MNEIEFTLESLIKIAEILERVEKKVDEHNKRIERLEKVLNLC